MSSMPIGPLRPASRISRSTPSAAGSAPSGRTPAGAIVEPGVRQQLELLVDQDVDGGAVDVDLGAERLDQRARHRCR